MYIYMYTYMYVFIYLCIYLFNRASPMLPCGLPLSTIPTPILHLSQEISPFSQENLLKPSVSE